METRAATWAKVGTSNAATGRGFKSPQAEHMFLSAGTVKAVDHVNKDIAPKLIEKVSANNQYVAAVHTVTDQPCYCCPYKHLLISPDYYCPYTSY